VAAAVDEEEDEEEEAAEAEEAIVPLVCTEQKSMPICGKFGAALNCRLGVLELQFSVQFSCSRVGTWNGSSTHPKP
jgi:hypothetical protein